MPDIFVQADDFSGAAEVADCFRTKADSIRVWLSPAPAAPHSARPTSRDLRSVDTGATTAVSKATPTQVTVVDTHSRAMEPRDAHAAVAAAFVSTPARRASLRLKKIDSLWRGNVAAEIRGLCDAGYLPIIAGALPALGRTVRDGVPFVDGKPLSATDLWRAEAAPPPRTVAELLTSGDAAITVAAWGLDQVRSPDLSQQLAHLRTGVAAVIVDGEDDSDLAAVVAAVVASGDDHFALVGSSGLALQLADLLPADESTNDSAAPLPHRGPRPTLAVIGTAAPGAREQAAHLVAHGFSTVTLAVDSLESQLSHELLHASLVHHPGATVALQLTGEINPDHSRTIVGALSRLVGAVLEPQNSSPSKDISGADLILTGGETAREILTALHVSSIEPLSSQQHGAVVSRANDGRLVATKPGSFGNAAALTELHHQIRTLRNSTQDSQPVKENS